jgi:hypothetical protein
MKVDHRAGVAADGATAASLLHEDALDLLMAPGDRLADAALTAISRSPVQMEDRQTVAGTLSLDTRAAGPRRALLAGD